MIKLTNQFSACAIAVAALLSACGGGGTTPSAENTNTNTSTSGATGTCAAAPCINFSETTLGMVDFGGLGIEVANDPADATNKVAKLTKATDDETWAGVTVHLGGAGNTVTRIDPAQGISLRVYSPAVGKTIMVKIEDASANGVEASATSTKAGEWETLTFTFATANSATTYNKVSVFPGFNTKLNEVYYIDELKYTAKGADPVVPASALTILNFDETTPATLDAFEGTSFEAAQDGTNKVAKLNKPTSAQPWGGATFKSCATGTVGATPAIPFTSTLQTVSIRVKAPRAGVTFSLEAKNVSDESILVFAQATNTGTDWETLSFNFTNKTFGTAIDASKTYNKFSIFPNFNKAQEGSASKETSDSVYYFDDVKLVGSTATLGTCPAAPVTGQPSTAPTTPTAAAGDVLSVFSNAYTAITGVNTNPNWGQSTAVTNETYASNDVLKLANLNYQGISWENNAIDLSTYTKLHIDLWSDAATSVDVFIIGGNGGGESSVNVPLTSGSWTSIDIPLSSYTTPASKSNIIQLKLVGNPGAKTVYLDNIYFKK